MNKLIEETKEYIANLKREEAKMAGVEHYSMAASLRDMGKGAQAILEIIEASL